MKRLAVALLVVAGLSACSGENPFEASATAATDTMSVEAGAGSGELGVEDNPFIPEGKNLSDCVSSLPQPNCGSADRGTRGAYMTMAALVLGVAFIGWRVSIGIRARDKVVNAVDASDGSSARSDGGN